MLCAALIQDSIKDATQAVIAGNSRLAEEQEAEALAQSVIAAQEKRSAESKRSANRARRLAAASKAKSNKKTKMSEDHPLKKLKPCSCGHSSYLKLYARGTDMSCDYVLPSGRSAEDKMLPSFSFCSYGDIDLTICTKCGKLYGFKASRLAEDIANLEADMDEDDGVEFNDDEVSGSDEEGEAESHENGDDGENEEEDDDSSFDEMTCI